MNAFQKQYLPQLLSKPKFSLVEKIKTTGSSYMVRKIKTFLNLNLIGLNIIDLIRIDLNRIGLNLMGLNIIDLNLIGLNLIGLNIIDLNLIDQNICLNRWQQV